ncbi:MAG TPA: hypothetical protein VF663_07890 [Telluria sp.]
MPAAALPPSIALAVLVAPSRRLRALMWLVALVHAGTAWHILSNQQNFAAPLLLAACCGAAAALCATAASQPLKVRRIDISKAGAVRLTVQHKVPGPGCAMRLMPGSLLLARFLVLRLASIDNATVSVQTVLVLPDSTDRASLRALVVAMRAIAGRNGACDVQKIG